VREGPGPFPWLGRLWGPLLADHVLILVGAYFVIAGHERGSAGSVALGASFVSAGVLLEAVVVVWTARQVRRLGPGSVVPSGAAAILGTGRETARCFSCGWTGTPGPSRVCRRCGRATIRDLVRAVGEDASPAR
jgi:hypothetical protein